jgi:hypothetical protein
MVKVAMVSLMELWLSLYTACRCYCCDDSWRCGILLNWLLVLLLMQLILFVGIFIVVAVVAGSSMY